MTRINQPADYGLSIISHDCLDGKVPCLLVEPDGVAGPGYRGRTLRQQLTERGVDLPAYGRVQGVVVLLHGRKGRKEDLIPVAERFVAAGYRCIIPDLPGHGDSPLSAMSFGSSAFERQLPAKVLEEMRATFGLPDEPAALWGMSMGGAFAVNAAGESAQDWDAMIVVSSFARLDDVMESLVPERWRPLFPALLALLNVERGLRLQPTPRSMSPERVAASLQLPTMVVHGDRDNYVSLQQGRNLYSALASQDKKWVTVPNGGHRSVLSTSMPVYAEMSEWLLRKASSEQE